MDIFAIATIRLASLGYTTQEADRTALECYIERAAIWLKSNLNRAEVPIELSFVWADMAAGLFLYDKKAAGLLPEIQFETPVKSISEGDTSVSFVAPEAGTAERQFDALLARLIHPDEAVLVAFRRLSW